MGEQQKMCSDVNNRSGHCTSKYFQILMIGWGHRTSKCVQVFKLGWGHCTGREQLGWGHRTTCKAEFQDFTTYPAGGWVGGPLLQEIMPLRGSILQVGTCQILSLAENPRWSRVWQFCKTKNNWCTYQQNRRLIKYRFIHIKMFTILGQWHCVKRTLPECGGYKLETYLPVFLWREKCKKEGKSLFWEFVKILSKHYYR